MIGWVAVAARTNSFEQLRPQPSEFICPLSREPMSDPVTAEDGHTYERAAITAWLRYNHMSPVSKTPLRNMNLFANRALRDLIKDYTRTAKKPRGTQLYYVDNATYVNELAELKRPRLLGRVRDFFKNRLAKVLLVGFCSSRFLITCSKYVRDDAF